MKTIFQLPQDVVQKIAAGEVIERPAYAVKELLDNAIDAHATVIQIFVEASGLKRITFIDDGGGMSREDLEICFLPHTTSKLKDEHELLGITTLGFRGEALSSLAAISDMTVKSRTKKSTTGTIVEIKNGKLNNVSSIGTPTGTIVEIKNLFSPVPARKKFLKTAATEFRHITDVVMQYALMYPKIHFLLTHNKKTIVDIAAKTDNADRIKYLLGPSLFEQLIPFSFEDGHIRLTGFLGKPQSASSNQKQYIFVNKRHVTDKLISLAVKESFGTLLPSSSYPVFLLHITLPHELVDVNVHPRKEHVSFVHPRQLFDAVKLGVTQTLSENNITFNLAKFKHDVSAKTGETTSFAAELLKETVLPWDRKDPLVLGRQTTIMQVHQTYLLAATEKGVTLFDQHAAHERILFEEFIVAFEKKKQKKENVMIKKPLKLSLSLSEKQILTEYEKDFTAVGFVFTKQKNDIFVTRIPTLFKGRNLTKILSDMLSDLSEKETIKTVDTTSKRMLLFLSCRGAVKAGDVLSEKDAKNLVTKLLKTKNNTTCPHGRPSYMTIPLASLHTFFKR